MPATQTVVPSYPLPGSGTTPTPPTVRRLRGYAFDPSLSLHVDTAAMNQTVFQVRWEGVSLEPGPVGEYLEVLDYDPASGCWYDPVDLNAIDLLAQDGVSPSEGNPKFHQQMVYAVAMKTIQHFEYALGRPILWAHEIDITQARGKWDVNVPRLRIYPHALRAANAYYSPRKKALLFGYFMSATGMVFSCLSHDIVAHETTHALLDGMHRRYTEDNHPDTLAFHEAFADLVALFQHFTIPEVLVHQIARTRGDLQTESLLGQLAQQFGEATGRYGALRDAIGEVDEQGCWSPLRPDPGKLSRTTEPHARGAILVAAVFGAFMTQYKSRSGDLVRMATAGTGVLPAGAIPPDLVQRLAAEANKVARQFLNICIRALDYSPPVDITFGDYLRAMVTADFDMVPDDRLGYRVALIESFRRWGIMPAGLRTLSEDQLRWPLMCVLDHGGWTALSKMAIELRPMISETLYEKDRGRLFELLREARRWTHQFLKRELSPAQDAPQREQFERVTGISISRDAQSPLRADGAGDASFEVHAVRPALRVSPDGAIMKQMIVIITQSLNVPIDPDDDKSRMFVLAVGCTLIFDLSGEPSLRYAIVRGLGDAKRLDAVRAYRNSKRVDGLSLRETYFGADSGKNEPFCMLHNGQ